MHGSVYMPRRLSPLISPSPPALDVLLCGVPGACQECGRVSEKRHRPHTEPQPEHGCSSWFRLLKIPYQVCFKKGYLTFKKWLLEYLFVFLIFTKKIQSHLFFVTFRFWPQWYYQIRLSSVFIRLNSKWLWLLPEKSNLCPETKDESLIWRFNRMGCSLWRRFQKMNSANILSKAIIF